MEKYFDSIATISTRRSAKNRWARYTEFCQDNSIPLFPVVGYALLPLPSARRANFRGPRSTIVALSIHVLANGDPDTGKAYDSHTSVINAARRVSAYLWDGEPGCETAGLNITANEAVKEFCSRARKAATNARGGVKGESSVKGSSQRGGKRKIEESASEASPAKWASAKKVKVDAPLTVVEGSGKKAAAAPVKRGVGRPRKIPLDSAAPPTPKRLQRKKVVPPPSSSSSSASESDSPPPPPPKRSHRKKVPATPSAKPKPVAALLKGNLATHESRTTRKTAVQKKEDELSTLTSLASHGAEEEVPMEVEEGEGPVGKGVFGRVVRWFGYGTK